MKILYYLNLSYTMSGTQVGRVYKFYANGQAAVESVINAVHLKMADKDDVRMFIQPADPDAHCFGIDYNIPYELFSRKTFIVCPSDKIEDVLCCLYSPINGVIIGNVIIKDYLFNRIESLSKIDESLGFIPTPAPFGGYHGKKKLYLCCNTNQVVQVWAYNEVSACERCKEYLESEGLYNNVAMIREINTEDVHVFKVKLLGPYTNHEISAIVVGTRSEIYDTINALYGKHDGTRVTITETTVCDEVLIHAKTIDCDELNEHTVLDALRPKIPYWTPGRDNSAKNVCGIEHSLSMANAGMLEWVQKQAKLYIENDVEATMEMYSKKSTKEDDKMFKIKDVQFHKDITTVIWSDDTKTMVKSPHGTITSDHDRQEGLMWALAKKFFGNKYDSLKEMDKILDSRRNDEYVVYIHYNDDGESFQRLTYLVVADNLKHAYKKAKARAKKDGLDISFIKAYPADKDLFYTISRHTDEPDKKYIIATVEARNEQHAIQRVAERDKVTMPGKKFTYKIESAKPAYDPFNYTRID